jgi:ABC-type transport system involved in multi-copper enzyme maturation permease subunit
MNRALIWREWQEMASQVCWAVAAIVFLVMTTRFVDEVVGVALTGAFLAMILGNAATASERSTRIREFLLTRPAARRRVLSMKLAITLAFLNGTLALIVMSVKLDLPGVLYGLVSETTLGERIIHRDSPVFYPTAIAFANLVLAFVLLTRTVSKSPTIGTVGAVVLMALGGMAMARLFAWWPGEKETIAVLACVACAAIAVGLFVALGRKFATLEITGGGS